MSEYLENNFKQLANWYTQSGEICQSRINSIILGYAELGIVALMQGRNPGTFKIRKLQT